MFENRIGGEFSYSDFKKYTLNKKSHLTDDQLIFLTGRHAFSAILTDIKVYLTPKTIHVPYYICDSVINTILSHNISISYYNLDEDFRVTKEYLNHIGKDEVLLIVNYFGFVSNCELVSNLKKFNKDLVIISDEVHSYWDFNTTNADYSFTSLRKHLPTFAGALVSGIKNSQDLFKENNEFFHLKLSGAILKNLNLDDTEFLRYFNLAESIIDDNLDTYLAPSIVSLFYNSLDLERIHQKRRENYHEIYRLAYARELPLLFDFNQDVVPLNVPLLVDRKQEILEGLMRDGIFLPTYWRFNDERSLSPQAKNLAMRQISLVIDHRYGPKEMKIQVDKILNLL